MRVPYQHKFYIKILSQKTGRAGEINGLVDEVLTAQA